MELAPFPRDRGHADGCRGFTGPYPSTPLDAYGYVGGNHTATPADGRETALAVRFGPHRGEIAQWLEPGR
jgi:hypothetical protein